MSDTSDVQVSAVGSISIHQDRVVQDAANIYKVALLTSVDGVEVGHTEEAQYKQAAAFTALATLVAAAFLWRSGMGPVSLGIGTILFVVFVVSYLASRQAVVTVYAGGVLMKTRISGKAFAEARNFAWTLTNAKRLAAGS